MLWQRVLPFWIRQDLVWFSTDFMKIVQDITWSKMVVTRKSWEEEATVKLGSYNPSKFWEPFIFSRMKSSQVKFTWQKSGFCLLWWGYSPSPKWQHHQNHLPLNLFLDPSVSVGNKHYLLFLWHKWNSGYMDRCWNSTLSQNTSIYGNSSTNSTHAFIYL